MNALHVEDKEKFDTITKYLYDEYVMVHLDASVDGVDVPAHLAGNTSLTLKISKLFRGVLNLEAHHISAELLFGSSYHTCHLPLRAVWGITTAKGKSLMWPASTPPDVLQSLVAKGKASAEAAPGATTDSASASDAKVIALSAVPKRSEKQKQEEPASPESAKPKKGHLKLVK